MITKEEFEVFAEAKIWFESRLHWWNRWLNAFAWHWFRWAFCPRCGKRWAKWEYHVQDIPIGDPLTKKQIKKCELRGIRVKNERRVTRIERVICECGLGMSKKKGKLYDIFIREDR